MVVRCAFCPPLPNGMGLKYKCLEPEVHQYKSTGPT